MLNLGILLLRQNAWISIFPFPFSNQVDQNHWAGSSDIYFQTLSPLCLKNTTNVLNATQIILCSGKQVINTVRLIFLL